MTDTPTADKAQAAASTAADETKHVAGVAQGEAAKVATEAKQQVSSLASEATAQVSQQASEQTKQQRDKLVGTLGSLSDDLDQMADGGQGLAADVAKEVAGHARALTSYLDGREPGELLEDVRDFARRRPGTFLLGALVAGIVAGRVARGVKDAPSASSGSPSAGAATPVRPFDGEESTIDTSLPSYPSPPVSPPPSSPPDYAQGPL